MPDTKRLPYPETSESYHLYLNDKSDSKTYESDEILIQSNIVNNANGSAFIEYNDAKGSYQFFNILKHTSRLTFSDRDMYWPERYSAKGRFFT